MKTFLNVFALVVIRAINCPATTVTALSWNKFYYSGVCVPLLLGEYRMVGNFHGYNFSRNRPIFWFQKFSRPVNLGPAAIASALSFVPLSGSCVCVYVAFQ